MQVAFTSLHKKESFPLRISSVNMIKSAVSYGFSVVEDDENLQIPGYDLTISEHPSNSKRGCVATYCKYFFPLKLIDVNYLSASIICKFISPYRSPSQTADNFGSFLVDLKLTLDTMNDNNPF